MTIDWKTRFNRDVLMEIGNLKAVNGIFLVKKAFQNTFVTMNFVMNCLNGKPFFIFFVFAFPAL